MDWNPNQPRLLNGTEMRRKRAEFVEYIEEVTCTVFHFSSIQRTDLITSLISAITYEDVVFRFLSKDELQSASDMSIHPSKSSV